MSWVAREWVVEEARLRCENPSQFTVLLALADKAREDGTNAYPAVDTIAAYALVSGRSVQRRLDELQALGLIRPGDPKTVAHIRSDRRPMVWDLAVPGERVERARLARGVRRDSPEAGCQIVTPTGCQDVTPLADGVPDCPPRGDNLSATGCQIVTRPLKEELQEQEQLSPPTPSSAADGDADEPERERASPIQDQHRVQAEAVAAAYTAATGRPATKTHTGVRDQARLLLAGGHDLSWLMLVAAAMPAKRWRDLDGAVDWFAARPDDLPGGDTAATDLVNETVPCGRCDPNGRSRETVTGAVYDCPVCHPNWVRKGTATPRPPIDPKAPHRDPRDRPLHYFVIEGGKLDPNVDAEAELQAFNDRYEDELTIEQRGLAIAWDRIEFRLGVYEPRQYKTSWYQPPSNAVEPSRNSLIIDQSRARARGTRPSTNDQHFASEWRKIAPDVPPEIGLRALFTTRQPPEDVA